MTWIEVRLEPMVLYATFAISQVKKPHKFQPDLPHRPQLHMQSFPCMCQHGRLGMIIEYGIAVENPAKGSELSAAVALPFEVEVEVHDAALEGALEALLVAVLPLLVDDAEGNVLIGRACMEPQQAGGAMLICMGVLVQGIGGCLCLVYEIGVEDVELVALHHLQPTSGCEL